MLLDIKFFLLDIIGRCKKKLVSILLFVVGALFVLLLSGTSFVTFGLESKYKIVLYAGSFLYFGCLLFFNIRISKIKGFIEGIKRKKIPLPTWITLAYLGILFFTILSLIFNRNKADNINSYISFLITISLTYFILIRFGKLFILKCFKNILVVLSILSALVFLVTLVSGTFFPSHYHTNERIIFGNHLFLNTDFISGLSYSLKWNLRMSGIFWEPGVFGTMLICGLFVDFFTKDKYSVYRAIVFTGCIILTSSTAAYILYIFYLIAVITAAFNKHKIIQVLFLVLVLVAVFLGVAFLNQIIEFLAKALPTVFGKFVNMDSITSFTTRLYSFRYYFDVFLKSPIFGVGGVTANEMYKSAIGDANASGTSTFGLMISSFGIAGIIYIVAIFAGVLFNNKLDWKSKTIIALVILLMSNSQGQSAILIVNILYLMPLSLVCKRRNTEATVEQLNPNIIRDIRVSDLVFAKNENGELSSNILFSLIIKIVSLLLAFFTVPVYLNYFNNSNSTYGVWLTITSVLAVVTIFDFGMGNGLKNKLIKNINECDYASSKKYVSTTYAITSLVGLAISVVPTIVIFSLKDSIILDVFFKDQILSSQDILSFRIGFMIIMFAIGSQFVFKNINYILQAHQKNAVSSSFMLITNTLLLMFALIFANLIDVSSKIIALSIAYFIFLNTPLIIASLILFSSKYRHLSPNVLYIDFRKSKEVISTGIKFFVVQIGSLFLWSANEFIILLVFKDSSLVTEYAEYYKLMSLLPIILGTVIQQPIWTAISRADIQKHTKIMYQYIKALIATTIGFVIINVVLTFSLPLVFDIWLGSKAPIVTFDKQIVFVVYSFVYIIAMGLVIVCNALSLFKAQIITAVMGIVVKIPIIIAMTCIPAVELTWELTILINMLCYVPTIALAPFEIAKYMKKKHPNNSFLNCTFIGKIERIRRIKKQRIKIDI